jgi:hypothetical protein
MGVNCTIIMCDVQKIQLVTGFSVQRPRINSRVVHVGFLVDKMAVEQFSFPLPIIISTMLHIHLLYEAGKTGHFSHSTKGISFTPPIKQ